VLFRSLRERLKPGARAGLQVITVADHLFASYRRGTDFIQKHVFPGGMLPSPGELRRLSAEARLDLVGSLEFGNSYSRTLREWRSVFDARWREIAGLGFDNRFRRLWDFYLTTCAACFAAGTTDVTQVTLARAG